MQVGTLHVWKPDRGFGFIRQDDGPHDLFCHVTSFSDRRQPAVGDRLQYETRLSQRSNKPEAYNIRAAS